VTSITQREGERPRRRMSAADRREAILQAALDAFADGGYHETSLEAVAERAGISKALIYEHFASKRELHRALLETYGRELLARVTEAIAAAEPGEARLKAGIDGFLRFVEERRDAWRMLVRNATEPDVARSVERLQGDAARAIGGLMAEDAEAAQLTQREEPEQAIEMFAQQLTGSLRALANWWDEHRDVPRERVLAIAMEFGWLGLDRLGQGERWG
jgi:AcrR family transcriptional regulator